MSGDSSCGGVSRDPGHTRLSWVLPTECYKPGVARGNECWNSESRSLQALQ